MQVIKSFRYKRLFWAYVFLGFTTLWIMFFYEPSLKGDALSDRHVRVWAMLLQLIGAGTVWYDLTHTATGFGAGPTVRKTLDYIKSVFVKSPPIRATGSITLENVTMRATGRVSPPISPEQPLEVRLAQLERFVQNLDTELGSIQAAISQQKSDLTIDIHQRTSRLHWEIQKVEGQLRSGLIGNFSILTFGVFWLGVGIVLASLPVEITEFSVYLNLFGLFH